MFNKKYCWEHKDFNPHDRYYVALCNCICANSKGEPVNLKIGDVVRCRVDKRCSKIPTANYLLSSGIMTYTNNAEYDEAKKNAITLLDCSECKKHFSEITKDN